MTDRPNKYVLIVENDPFTRNDLRREFGVYSRNAASEYAFVVETAASIREALDKVRARRADKAFDVVVLDLSFDDVGLDREGLQLANALGLYRRLGQAIPVEIIFSGRADVRVTVQAMRHGVWDVIDKKSADDDTSAFRKVVESAVDRLKALDLQELLNDVAVTWLQQNIVDLQERYGGQVIAIWHEPNVRVIAAGRDVFELETRLDAWRKEHAAWMYPLVVQIPGTRDIRAKAAEA